MELRLKATPTLLFYSTSNDNLMFSHVKWQLINLLHLIVLKIPDVNDSTSKESHFFNPPLRNNSEIVQHLNSIVQMFLNPYIHWDLEILTRSVACLIESSFYEAHCLSLIYYRTETQGGRLKRLSLIWWLTTDCINWIIYKSLYFICN